MELVNLTPHNVNFMDEDGNVLKTIKPAAEAPRLKTFKGTSSQIDVDGVSIPLSGALSSSTNSLMGSRFLPRRTECCTSCPRRSRTTLSVSDAPISYHRTALSAMTREQSLAAGVSPRASDNHPLPGGAGWASSRLAPPVLYDQRVTILPLVSCARSRASVS